MTVPAGTQDLIGSHYRFPDYFQVGREKIREFAKTIKSEHPSHYAESAAAEAGYPGLIAPLTFLAIAGRRLQLELFSQFDVPINIARVFHRDQKIKFHRPIVAGDRLYFDAYLDSVLQAHGTVISEIRSEVTDAAGQPVVTSVVTMIGEAADHQDSAEAAVAAIASIGSSA